VGDRFYRCGESAVLDLRTWDGIDQAQLLPKPKLSPNEDGRSGTSEESSFCCWPQAPPERVKTYALPRSVPSPGKAKIFARCAYKDREARDRDRTAEHLASRPFAVAPPAGANVCSLSWLRQAPSRGTTAMAAKLRRIKGSPEGLRSNGALGTVAHREAKFSSRESVGVRCRPFYEIHESFDPT
jgi:hypothetical protein